jgi:hypothetical protein
VDDTVDAIKASAAKRQFFWVYLHHVVTAHELEDVLDQLAVEAPNIVPLSPDECIRLYLVNYAGLPIYPTDDSHVREGSPTNNYGDNEYLRVRGTGSSKEAISYFKFTVDVSGSITSAKLKIRTQDQSIDNATSYVVNDVNWTETTITWNDKPAVGSSLDTITNLGAETWYEFDVSSHITESGTYSLALKTTQDAGFLDFYSSESAYKPFLKLTCGVPEKAGNPSPADSATNVSITTDLSWDAATGADNYDVYFGTSSPGNFQGNQTGTTFDPGTMDENTTYYWRIDPNNGNGTTTGDVWSFTTEASGPVTDEFNPTDDTYVKENLPDDTAGGASVLRVRASGSNKIRYAYLKFSVSGVSGTVTSAKLKIRTEDDDIDDTSVYAVSGSWDEDTLCWNNDDLAWGNLLDTISDIDEDTWYEFDVSDEVDGNGTYTLGLKTTQDAGKLDWCSKETTYVPVLEVTYQP